jgi:hypothetical protein
MIKQLALVALLTDLMAVPSSFSAAVPVQPAPLPARCLHGPSEQPSHRMRREQALAMAQQINRAESNSLGQLPSIPKRYRPFAQLENVPAAPADFKLQFYTDGPTYTFSLKDTLDACQYAIFSDQDKGIYQATVERVGVRVLPAETP